MPDLRRVAAIVRKRREHAGDARLRRRLAAAGLTGDQIEAAFRYARFLELRQDERPARQALGGRALAGAGVAAWTLLIAAAATLRLWWGPGPRPAEAMPEQLRIRDRVAAYRPLPLSPPRLLDVLLPRVQKGDACAAFLEAAVLARSAAVRLLEGKEVRTPPGLDLLASGALLQDCAILGRLRLPESEDEWARLRLDVALIGGLLEALGRRAERSLAAERYDLAEADAINGLAAGRRLLDDWLPESQAAGVRAVESSARLLGRALAGRGLLDGETRVRLGRIVVESRAYAADPVELERIALIARSPDALDSLSRRLEGPSARAYGLAALEGAALNWSPAEIRAGRPDPRRLLWLSIAARCGNARLSALAWASVRRLVRSERDCLRMSPGRRFDACPAIKG